MKKKLLLIPLLVVFTFAFTTNLNAAASSQFKSYDKRDNATSTDYKTHTTSALENMIKNTGAGAAVDATINYAEKYAGKATQQHINNIRKYVSNNMPAQSSFKNFKDYQNVVRNMRQMEQNAVKNAEKFGGNLGKTIKAGGTAVNVYNLYNDIKDLNKESKHKHSSIKQLELTLRYMKVGYNGGAMYNKGLQPAATVTSLASDAVSSDEFVNWANEQDNEFLDFLDDITDKINDKAYRDACQLLEWLGINPPNSLPALRTAIKPNIYLYPEKDENISVIFDSPELLLTVIPDYNNGWYTYTKTDGTLIVDGEEYTYLFYESATSDKLMQKEEAFITPIENRYEFFEEVAKFYSFNETETKDFAEFWDSRLDKDKEYIMYPQLTKEVDAFMPVKINPTPDNYFRVWFLFYTYNGEEYSEVTKVEVDRSGYEMIEWGGIVAE